MQRCGTAASDYTRPLMKILLVNWVRPSMGTALGGGVSGYCQQLGLELASRGHDVCWLAGGQIYTPDSAGDPGPCAVRRTDDFAGRPVFEVVNSPVVSPGPCQAREPGPEIAAPVLEAELRRFLDLLEPDIVHFHNLEGFSAGCLRIAAQPGPSGRRARVIFSLHNYHTVCPQVYLMQRGRVPCTDSDQGRLCPGCLEPIDPAAERARRAREFAAIRSWAPAPAPPPPAPDPGLLTRLGLARTAPPPPALPPAPPPPVFGTPVSVFLDVTVRRTDSPRPLAPVPDHLTPLDNTISPEPVPPPGASPHGDRRAANVRALSNCDRVIAVSRFVANKFASLGVDARRISVLPLGTRMVEIAAEARSRLSPPPASPRLRLAFIGYCNFFKGLHVLLDALGQLPTSVSAEIDLLVAGTGVDQHASRLEALRPALGALRTHGGYAYHEIPWLLADRDLGVVPSVWWDNGPQTVMEFFACGVPVLGAGVGGIPDWVSPGVNGLLFRANDRADLAANLAELVQDRRRVQALRAGVTEPRSMGRHAEELEAIYAETLG